MMFFFRVFWGLGSELKDGSSDFHVCFVGKGIRDGKVNGNITLVFPSK